MRKKYKTLLQIVLAGVIIVAAAFSLYHLAHRLQPAHIWAALLATPPWRMGLSGLGTVVSFLGLALYERYATHHAAPGQISTPLAMYVGVITQGISNTVGFHLLTSVAIRYRAYKRSGLDAADVGRVVALVGLCVALGTIVILAVAWLVGSGGPLWHRLAGGALLVGLGGAVAALPVLAKRVRFKQLHLPDIHSRGIAIQILIGLMEMSGSIFAFYILLPSDVAHGLAGFIMIVPVVIVGMFMGVLSHAPGGLGIFEITVLTALPDKRSASVLAALLLYRVFYNLLPFCASLLAVGLQYAWSRWRRGRDAGDA